MRYADLFSATMVGFASGLLIPRAGELLRPWLVSRRYPIPISAGFATIILERLVDMITVLVLFAAYLFVLPAPAAQTEGSVLFRVWGLQPTAMHFIRAVEASPWWPWSSRSRSSLALHANAERAIALARREARAGAALARRARSAGSCTPSPTASQCCARRCRTSRRSSLQSLLIWLLIALGFHLNHVAFGIDLPFHATFLLIAFLVVGVAIPTPGMVGGFHAFYLMALADVFGVARERAAAAGDRRPRARRTCRCSCSGSLCSGARD